MIGCYGLTSFIGIVMKSKELKWWICLGEDCTHRSDYLFTDVKQLQDGQWVPITLGYSCDSHFEEVKKMLEEQHDTKYKA